MFKFIKIRNRRDVAIFVVATTALSVILSLGLFTVAAYLFLPDALTYKSSFILAAVIPLIIAPIVGISTGSLVLKLEAIKLQLEKLSQTDALTHLYNRGFFWKRTKDELLQAKSKNERVTLIIFDIDNFKQFNDTYGHLVGDEILKACAKTAANCIRKNDLIARYGGEEFAVFLKDCSVEDALQTAERIRQDIANIELVHNNQKLSTTVSIGIATSTESKELEELVYIADKAMYQAKHQGKNQAVWIAA